MKNAFTKIFFGYLISQIELHMVFIDLLPDPIGYFLIFLGVRDLLEGHPAGRKAANWALALIFISLPTVLIPMPSSNGAIISEAGEIYHMGLPILQLILVFYLFQLLLEIAEKGFDLPLQNRTLKLFRFYIVWMLAAQICGAFLLGSTGQIILFFLTLGSLLLKALFLMLVWRFRITEHLDPADQLPS